MDAAESWIAVLEERLRRYPEDRYPVQHATAEFHLGLALADAARTREAEAALESAARVFATKGLELEHAKALNALGAVYRLAGRFGEARNTFVEAAAAFERNGRDLERGAAEFNLALVLRSLGDREGAFAGLERARLLLDPGRVPAEAGAAARELGTLLAETGDERAAKVLEVAVALAERGDDLAGRGAAANALGLALLADGRTADAVDTLRTAVASSPRSVRPGEYAMTKANLALALERAGDIDRARLAALQARAVPAAAPPVRAQAEAVLSRLPPGTTQLAALAAEEAPGERAALLRDEIARWIDAGDEGLRVEAAAWIRGVSGRDDAEDLWEALVAVLLELPTEQLEPVARGLAPAADDVRRAAVRFHGPQADRLGAVFTAAAET